MLVKYITKNGERIGVVVADKVSDSVYNIDYSICSSYDKFDKELGRKIAIERCHRSVNRKRRVNQEIHPDAVKEYIKMANRCKKYFKTELPSKKVYSAIEKYMSSTEKLCYLLNRHMDE